MPRARIGALILVILYSSLCTFRLIKWLSFLVSDVYLFYDLVPALYFLDLSGIFLFITGYFPLGILQWYQSIILAQPVVYDIRKKIIQRNSSAIPETQLEKGPK